MVLENHAVLYACSSWSFKSVASVTRPSGDVIVHALKFTPTSLQLAVKPLGVSCCLLLFRDAPLRINLSWSFEASLLLQLHVFSYLFSSPLLFTYFSICLPAHLPGLDQYCSGFNGHTSLEFMQSAADGYTLEALLQFKQGGRLPVLHECTVLSVVP